MSTTRDLVATLGISQEEAENILEALGAKEKTKELMELGVVYKSLDDIETELETLDRDTLKALYIKVGQLLKERKAEGRKIILTYEPVKAEKSAVYVNPLDKTLQEGISDIEAAKREVKQKARVTGYRSFEDMQKGTVADDIAAIEEVRYRKTKGKSGRWSGPPIEMTCEESIAEIERWRREHGQ